MKKKNTTKSLIEELKKKKSSELRSIIANLNSYRNVSEFHAEGVDMKQVLEFGVLLLMKQKVKIPSGGYFDLIELVENKASK